MFIFNSIVLLSIPIIILGFGFLWIKYPPDAINGVYGYRTPLSTKNQKTWDFAQKFSGKTLRYTGVLLGIISIAILFIFRNYNNVFSIIAFIQVLGVFLSIITTEIALRKRFDKNGNRRRENFI